MKNPRVYWGTVMDSREKREGMAPVPLTVGVGHRFSSVSALARRLIRSAKRVRLRLSKKKLLWYIVKDPDLLGLEILLMRYIGFAR